MVDEPSVDLQYDDDEGPDFDEVSDDNDDKINENTAAKQQRNVRSKTAALLAGNFRKNEKEEKA